MDKKYTEIYTNYSEQDFETLLNIESMPYIETFTNHHSNRYEPTIYQDLVTLIEVTQSDYDDTSLLIDFGSGLMRVPIFLNFILNIQAMGIELNKQLYLKSKTNIKDYQLKHQSNHVSALNINALQYHFTGQETHLFFFNPFSIFIFQKVMENLMDSAIEHCYIILYYAKPEYEIYLSDLINFKLKYSIPLKNFKEDPSEKINIYQYTQISKGTP
ncbi:hypothetical protein [Macrococcus animalis]|uniref:hypothetical protein n=1 Tax=Macrococcus animalis TaxID=3395467 RepID=UPI0039BE4DDE